MAMKLDLSGVKSFFFEKGEKLGMFACAAAAVGLIGYGLMGGIGANTGGYASSIKGSAQRIGDLMQKGHPTPPADTAKKAEYTDKWPVVASDFPQGSLFPTQDTANYTKRLNPKAMGILAFDPKKKHFQMTYINGTYQAYDISHSAGKFATTIRPPTTNTPAPKKGEPRFPNLPNRQGIPGGAGAGLEPVITLQPTRMVVVDAVFPFSEQLEAYRRALRKSHVAELFLSSGDLPRFLGMTVYKFETAPGAKEPVMSVLINYDPKGNKVELDPLLQKTLREALPDQEWSGNAPCVLQGLVMMLPKLSAPPESMREYPKADLEGIDWENLVGGAGQPGGQPNRPPVGPGGRQGAGPGVRQPVAPQAGVRQNPGVQMPGAANAAGTISLDVELNPKTPWKDLTPELNEKFNDKFFPLDQNGIFPDPDEGKPQAGGTTIMPTPPSNRTVFGGQNANVSPYQGQSPNSATSQWPQYPYPPLPADFVGANGPNQTVAPFPGPRGVPPGQGAANMATKPYEGLVRFIDVGVKPGYSYKYAVQVWVANPNFGYKKSEVQVAAWADIPFLPPAPPVETPSIEIPREYFLYAIDQKPNNAKIVNGSEDKEAKADQVAVQIHRWAEKAADISNSEFVVGDWVIAERLLLRRGDPIGRIVNIEIPIWNKKHGVYDLDPAMLGAAPPQPKKIGFEKGKAPAAKKAVGAEIGEIGGIPVSFAETIPPSVLVDFDGGKTKRMNISDESASNLLILNADGKLIVRSSRIDSDPNSDEFKVRQQRIEDWKTKVEPYRLNDNPMINPNPAPGNRFIGGGPAKG